MPIGYSGQWIHQVMKERNRGVAQPGSAPALGAGSRRFKSSRPDQPSLLNGVKNEGCRVEAKGEDGPHIEIITKATARHAFSSKRRLKNWVK